MRGQATKVVMAPHKHVNFMQMTFINFVNLISRSSCGPCCCADDHNKGDDATFVPKQLPIVFKLDADGRPTEFMYAHYKDVSALDPRPTTPMKCATRTHYG